MKYEPKYYYNIYNELVEKGYIRRKKTRMKNFLLLAMMVIQTVRVLPAHLVRHVHPAGEEIKFEKVNNAVAYNK